MSQAGHFIGKTIGLFDSGVGGLSVVRQLEQSIQLSELALNGQPKTKFVYLGDTARCPYGGREAQEIVAFADQISGWLLNKNVDALVMACNTSAALAASTLRSRLTIPVYDLIEPTAKAVAGSGAKIGVLATASTVKSAAFAKAVAALDPQLAVTEIACPDLVSAVEKGHVSAAQSSTLVAKYVDQLLAEKVDAIVFGCTHFPFLRPAFEALLPPHIRLIDPAQCLASQLFPVAAGAKVSTIVDLVSKEFYVTGSTQTFVQAASTCLSQSQDALGGTVYGVTLDELNGFSALSGIAAPLTEIAPLPTI